MNRGTMTNDLDLNLNIDLDKAHLLELCAKY